MFRAVTLALILVLSGCASITMVRKLTDCAYETGRFNDGFRKDVVTGVAKAVTRNYICVESPEVVRLPSYIQLLELPPAKRTTSCCSIQLSRFNRSEKSKRRYCRFFNCSNTGCNCNGY